MVIKKDIIEQIEKSEDRWKMIDEINEIARKISNNKILGCSIFRPDNYEWYILGCIVSPDVESKKIGEFIKKMGEKWEKIDSIWNKKIELEIRRLK